MLTMRYSYYLSNLEQRNQTINCLQIYKEFALFHPLIDFLGIVFISNLICKLLEISIFSLDSTSSKINLSERELSLCNFHESE